MEYFNLTIPQQNIWNLQKYYENTAISNICGTIFYKSAKNIELLKKSLNIVIDRQAGLRLRFVEDGGTPKQYVEKYSPADIPVRRFENMEQLEQYVREAAKTPVRLLNNVMYRFEIVCVGTEAGILAILNHLISDAWTLSLIAKQVHEAYRSLDGECGQSYDEMDYIDYVKSEQNYLHSDKFQKDLIYWNEKYKSKPDKAYVKMSCLPVKQITAQRFVKKSSEELSEAVKEYCGKNPVTPAVLFETAMYVYLSKINHEISNITIGIPVLNRSNAKEKKTAGMYISTMPLTVEVQEDECVSELAKKITEGHRNIFRHKKYPYSMILENVREKHDFTGNMYDVMVSFQNAQADSESVTKWYGNGYSEIPFAWHIDNRDYDNSYTWTIDYQTEVFCQPQEIEYIVERLEYILWQIVKSEDKLLKDISIIPPEEQKKLLLDFNNTAAAYPKDKCVHELFTEQAKRTPEKTALVFEDKKFTYRELDEMSNSLAHFLREKGVGRNDIVPIIAKRSWHVIVAMLGILKAGGAYMPVDPNYPKDRVEYMIGEANVKCCLIYKFFELDNVETYNLSEINYNLKVDNVYNINNVTDICYVIYTSGSTGKPKGICQTHQCLSNLLMWQVKKCGSDNYNILGDTIITFDVSVQEIVYSLVSGKCLFFTDDLIKMNLQAYLDYIEKNKIDTIFVTPSYFAQLVSYNNVNKLYN
ncbi:MAG: AMP-binding protein, partial [Lachnospira sp.]|nr:AMP-binding protein [Lachnospira sp.]